MYQRRQRACSGGGNGVGGVLASHHATESSLKATWSLTEVRFVCGGDLFACASDCGVRMPQCCFLAVHLPVFQYYFKHSSPGCAGFYEVWVKRLFWSHSRLVCSRQAGGSGDAEQEWQPGRDNGSAEELPSILSLALSSLPICWACSVCALSARTSNQTPFTTAKSP